MLGHSPTSFTSWNLWDIKEGLFLLHSKLFFFCLENDFFLYLRHLNSDSHEILEKYSWTFTVGNFSWGPYKMEEDVMQWIIHGKTYYNRDYTFTILRGKYKLNLHLFEEVLCFEVTTK